MAEQTPGGLNEQVPSLDSRRVHRWGCGSLVACDECVLLCLQCVLLCFRRCSASSPKQGRTRPSPTRLTALLRAFSNGKRQSSRKSPTLQRPIEVAIDCSEHRALQTVLRLAGVRSCMRAAWLHSGCGSRELRGDSVEDERLSFTSRDSFSKQRRCLGEAERATAETPVSHSASHLGTPLHPACRRPHTAHGPTAKPYGTRGRGCVIFRGVKSVLHVFLW